MKIIEIAAVSLLDQPNLLAWYTLFTRNKHSAMNKKRMLEYQSNKNITVNVRELPIVFKPEKAKTVLES